MIVNTPQNGFCVCQTQLPLAVILHQATDGATNDHTAPHMHLPMVTWFFFCHMVSMVTEQSSWQAIRRLYKQCTTLRYTMYVHTHTHTVTQPLWCNSRYETGVVLWGKGWRQADIQEAATTFQEHQMPDGKPGVLADILQTASGLPILHTAKACNNNGLSENNKSLTKQRKWSGKEVAAQLQRYDFL